MTSLFIISPFAMASFKNVNNEETIRQKIMDEFSQWEGVKYRLGGTTKKGIDCSSLTQKIYHAAFKGTHTGHLPRTTAQQVNKGVKASRSNLKPGDLIFFKMPRGRGHVGVYIGDEKFVHASTSKGVIISTLENDYWSARFKTARRIIS